MNWVMTQVMTQNPALSGFGLANLLNTTGFVSACKELILISLLGRRTSCTPKCTPAAASLWMKACSGTGLSSRFPISLDITKYVILFLVRSRP
jgi:hypothetical protein